MNGVSFGAAEIGIVGALLGALAAAIVALWKADIAEREKNVKSMQGHIDALDERISALVIDRDAYRDIAEESLAALDAVRARARGSHNEDDFKFITRVRPPHHSEATRAEESDAEVQTMRVRLGATKKDLIRLTEADYVS